MTDIDRNMTSDTDQPPAPPGFAVDERRPEIIQETLRRPPLPIALPGHAAHLVFVTDADEADAHKQAVLALLGRWQARIDLDRYDQIIAFKNDLTVKWERHTEFCSLTLLAGRAAATARTDPGLAAWPPLGPDWAETVPGKLLVALKLTIEADGTSLFAPDFVQPKGNAMRIMSSVNGGTARVETAYFPADDGYMHLRISTSETNQERIGRLVQRLAEIETYRTLTLIAWPSVHAIGPQLNEIDEGVQGLTEELGGLDDFNEEAEHKLLTDMTELARELEEVSAKTHFRLNASLAYAELVQRRLEELQEERLEGAQRLSSLVNRRMRPAARTYRAILTRQAEMSARISRASDLLRSRIDVELARQNKKLLASMDRRADQQLRLQETVEGLSVVAISYYAIGILGYVVTALMSFVHIEVEEKVIVGLLAPFVVILVYLAIRRIRHTVGGHAGK